MLAEGERLGQLRLREDRIEGGLTIHGNVITSDTARARAAFSFDPSEAIWRWKSPVRMVVEVTDE